MVNEALLQEYSSSVERLKKQCMEAGMTEDEFRRLYFESLDSLENRSPRIISTRWKYITKYRIVLIGLFVTLCIVYNFKSIYSTLVCNLQEYIYPGLRLLRRISIPFISLFPGLTDLYHETCLIQNPFFTVVDMDCWPCSSVTNTEQQVINLKALKELYIRNKELFNQESPKVLVNSKYYLKPNEVFNTPEVLADKNFFVWKFNTMNIARVLRQAIPRPKVVPKFGQSTERFLIMDSRQELFHVPDTECSFSFLLVLIWYNWWYWRPVVQPSLGNNTLIAHVGSYC
ncbi:hypothetical protein MSG28_001736 [Choristoneura fumiferana]|uniref:Uncharacterized protein n=1 Tax=Choristoneura fumiferana TaxID=7141 RepID=A0ACC0KV76_CHOFU|nr:hypothetical protein MSG28_001736 [Choristoneura fumiferana]